MTAYRFENVEGDAAKELIITGGVIGSVGAGPQRQRTETYAWRGGIYTLSHVEPATAVYLYHAAIDADALFAQGQYAPAEAAYLALAGNPSLMVWKQQGDERAELSAYALFRAALSSILTGADRDAASRDLARAVAYEGTLHRQLAAVFEGAFEAKGDVAVACSAVRDTVAANRAEYEAFWDYGYGNPPFDLGAICPF